MNNVAQKRSDGLEHLRTKVDPQVLKRAEQIRELQSVHLPTKYDDLLDEELNRMLSHVLAGNEDEGYALVVTGKSGAGKSTTIKQRLRAHPAFAAYVDQYGNTLELCLSVRTPPGCTMKALGEEILRRAGYPLQRKLSETEVWNLVRSTLRRKQYRVIFLDEFQHVLKAPSAKGVTHTTDTVKSLMQDQSWPVWLILAGVPEMLEFIDRDADGQMQRRAQILRVGDMEPDDKSLVQLRKTVNLLAETCGLDVGFPLNREFLMRLGHAGLWRMGMTIQLIKLSVEAAIWDNRAPGSLLFRHFMDGYTRLSDCAADSNVFVVDDWPRIQREVTEKGMLTRDQSGMAD